MPGRGSVLRSCTYSASRSTMRDVVSSMWSKLGLSGARVHLHVGGLAVDLPVGERQPQHRHGEHRGNDVGEVVDEVEATGLDHVVDAGPGEVVDERLPLHDRGGGEERVEHPPVLRLLRWVHLDEPPTGRSPRRDRDPLVPVAQAVGVVVVRQQVGALGECAQLLVSGDDPEALVLGAPRHRALLAELVRRRGIGLAVLGCVLVELDNDPIVRCHRKPPGEQTRRWPDRRIFAPVRTAPPTRARRIGSD